MIVDVSAVKAKINSETKVAGVVRDVHPSRLSVVSIYTLISNGIDAVVGLLWAFNPDLGQLSSLRPS